MTREGRCGRRVCPAVGAAASARFCCRFPHLRRYMHTLAPLSPSQAFAALTHMEHVAVHAVLESMDACAARIKHVTPPGVPADAVATIVRACRTPAAAKAGEGDDLAVLHAWLERCLPVLNGLLYTSSKARAWLSSNAGWGSGLAPLLRVYVLDVPANVRVFAAFVMTNLSIARDAALQDTVRCCCCCCCCC